MCKICSKLIIQTPEQRLEQYIFAVGPIIQIILDVMHEVGFIIF